MKTTSQAARIAASAVLCALTLGVQATSAHASDAVAISGVVECSNAAVSGVYVHASESTSGFAEWEVDPGSMGMAALWSARYEFTLDHGGSYWLSVGCGGDRDNWGTVTKTGLIFTDEATSSCNDIHPLLALVGEAVYGRVVARVGWDFTGEASYTECSTEQGGSDLSSPESLPAVGPQTATGTVIASHLNVRADASVGSPILYSIDRRTVVTIECQKRGDPVLNGYWTDLWDRITVNGTSVAGFASDAFIDTGGPEQVARTC